MNDNEMFEDAAQEEKQEADMLAGVAIESREAKTKLATVTAKLDALIASAKSINVTSQAEYDAAKLKINEIKTAAKSAKDLRLFITRPIDAMKSYFMDMFDKPVKAAEEVIADIDGKRSIWFNEQERKRIAEQARLDKEARDKENKERERLERERQKAIAKGNAEKAEELAQQKAAVFVPAAQAASAAGKGDIVKMVYTGEVTDIGQIPAKYMTVNEKAIIADIEASKGTIQIPGYKYSGKSVVSTLNRGGK